MSQFILPYAYIADPTKGRPLFNADLYFGLPDLDPTIPANQVPVVIIQENGTPVSVTQPIQTGAGGIPLYQGSPAIITIGASEYSFRALDRHGEQVYYAPRVASAAMSNEVSRIFGTADDGTTQSLVSATGLSPGQFVRTEGYSSPGDGGGNDYLIVPAGTGIADGGSFIDLPGSGFQAMALFPNGHRIDHWGIANSGSDSSSAYQNAINYAISNGIGELKLPGVVTRIQSTIMLQGGSVTLNGSGSSRSSSQTTEIILDTGSSNGIVFQGCNGGGIRNCRINGQSLTGGSAVRIEGSSQGIKIDGIRIANSYNAVTVESSNTTRISNSDFISFSGDYGIKFYGLDLETKSDVLDISKCVINAGSTNTTSDCLVHDSYADTLRIRGVTCLYGRRNFWMTNTEITDTALPKFVFATNLECERGFEQCIFMHIGRSAIFTNCYAAISGSGPGCRFDNTFSEITWNAGYVRGNSQYGMLISANDTTVIGSIIGNNSVEGSALYPGIGVSANTDNVNISHCRIGLLEGGNNNQSYGVENASTGGTSVIGNNLIGNVTSGFSGLIDNVIVSNNQGYVSESWGVVEDTPDADGNFVIPHGLDAMPSYVNTKIRGDTTANADPQIVTASDITVRIKDPSGADVVSGNRTVYWEARL